MRFAARVCLASSAMALLLGCHRRSLVDESAQNDASRSLDASVLNDAGQSRDGSAQDDASQSFDTAIDIGARHDTRGHYGDMCWSDGDCVLDPFQPPPLPYCLAPDNSGTMSYVCPVCYTPPTICAADGECASNGPTSICAAPGCTCNNVKTCVNGCAKDSECPAGNSCGTDHRCTASPCGAGAPACPTDFVCGTGQTCQRRSCTSDAECSAACVIGKCFDRPGVCRSPPV
jgi:hypothetical protein